jgi:DNA modification methylase
MQTLLALGLETLPAVIWRKPTNSPTKFMGSGMLPGSAYVTLEHEYIIVLRKGGARRFARQEEDRRRRSALFWEERNQWYSDLWDLRGTRQELPDGAGRKRSGAFPLEVPFRLVHMYSIQGDTVLDPFGGTGTTALAAAAGGRSSVTVERDRELYGSIELLVRDGLGAARERVTRRLQDHREFRRRYEDEKGELLPYRNEPLGTGVRTRQERELLPLLPGQMESEERGFRLRHRPAPGEPPELF